MKDLELITIFALGLSIGSFLNVCIYRLPRGYSLFSRSACLECKKDLNWYELFPILSYVLLRGRCKGCHANISIEYLIVESISGILAIFVLFTNGISWTTTLQLVFLYGMLVITVIDWKHLIILDGVLLVLVGIGLFYAITLEHQQIWERILSGLLSFIILWVIKSLGDRIFQKETMGFGDIKLAGVLGFYLGLELLLVVIWVSSIVGSLFGLLLVFILNKKRDTKLPFGSILAVISSIALIYKTEIEYWLNEWIMKAV